MLLFEFAWYNTTHGQTIRKTKAQPELYVCHAVTKNQFVTAEVSLLIENKYIVLCLPSENFKLMWRGVDDYR